MGEAKRRVLASSKDPIGRGLLFSVNGSLLSTNEISWQPPSHDKVNFAVLYFDKLACPTTNFIHVVLPHEEVLRKEDLLLRPRYIASGTYNGRAIANFELESFSKTFSELERSRPGFWAMANDEPSDLVGASTFVSARSALIELVSALPLPPTDTPIEDILEFKAKRLAELKRLRDAIDILYIGVANSGDPQMATNLAIKEIDKSCADATKAATEWWKGAKMADLKSMISFTGAGLAAALGYSAQMPTTTAILGGAGAFVAIGKGIEAKIKQNRRLPFWYAAEITRGIKRK